MVLGLLLVAACTGDGGDATGTGSAEAPGALLAGAASRSVLPTVDGDRDYLDDAPGWGAPGEVDPFDPGVFVAEWDQGQVDVGNGAPDGSWVHDDLRAAAVALQLGDQRVVLVSTDTYLHFGPDHDEIVDRVRDAVPEEWSEAEILISATHNHHGPDSAFSINDEWYDQLAGETVDAVVEAIAGVGPASLRVAEGEHRFGVNDVRDPVVIDPRVNVLAVDDGDGDAIATVVNWAAHPEITLGWEPPADAAGLDEACAVKDWDDDDCSAEGRYFTADFPGVLRDRLHEDRGGEVLFLNGALGNQIGPGAAPAWQVTEDHPVGNGWTVPEGAEPLTDCDDDDPYLCRSFAKTEAIGTQLAVTVSGLLDSEAEAFDPAELTVRTEEFFTGLTNIGFRLLIADGDIGWQDAVLWTCDGDPSPETCTDDGGELVDDELLTPFVGSQIRAGDVVASRVTHLDLGEVGFVFMPGEIPPELVVGVPADFDDNTDAYYRDPELHAVGADYDFPGYLLDLVDHEVTFTVGLGTDQLGYWVPLSDYRLTCLDLVTPEGTSCEELAGRGVIDDPGWIAGEDCRRVTDDPAAFGDDAEAVTAICRYGQALGRELGEPPGHYEETNAAGWDLVDDLWEASVQLFGREGSGRVNPDLTGVTPIAPAD